MRTGKYLLFVFISFITASCSITNRGDKFITYVDTRVGTDASITKSAGVFGKAKEDFGQTLPAVLEPNGMNFWTAQTQDTERKCKAPYYYRDSIIQGFRNSHWIVGGCTQDYGSMTLMPLFGKIVCQPEMRGSRFSHDNEIATSAYYSTYLKDYNINVEMTGRSRSAIFRFTYDKAGDGYLVVNPNSDEGEGYIEIDTINREIRGYNPVHRIYQGWGESAGFNGYFIISYDKEITGFGTFKDDSIYYNNTTISNKENIGAFIRFKTDKQERIIIKVSSSFTDMDGARKNLISEIPHNDFENTRRELTEIWENQLGKISVETKSSEDKDKFYGALYRASFLPRTFNDVDGRYPSFAKGSPILQLPKGENYYEDYSMWDTYRALHPLLNIISTKKSGEMMQSLVMKYEQGGWLPIFPCWNSYTAAMIGDHSISVLADAYCKGIRNFDTEKAYEAMRKNAFTSPASFDEYKDGMGRRALKSYMKYGYIPLEDSVNEAFHTNEQVSRTLEYAYDDFALAQLAKALNKSDDYKKLIERAKNYKNVISPITGYAQGRYADGSFLEKDNAFSFTRFITEGAPCHYTWYVPQDVYGLMKSMGGKDKYYEKLDSMFTQRRYWHGNEPCHQVAYMFNYAGTPWRTQKEVKNIMESEYLNKPGGISGNDDAGQMSAWYIFSAIGFYPVCPASPYYIIGTPTFYKTVVKLENGKEFVIWANNVSKENIYIQSATLNGKVYDKNYISHDDIMNGGELKFEMGAEPNKEWASKPSSCPPDLMEE